MIHTPSEQVPLQGLLKRPKLRTTETLKEKEVNKKLTNQKAAPIYFFFTVLLLGGFYGNRGRMSFPLNSTQQVKEIPFDYLT